jgi:hypothetical protein
LRNYFHRARGFRALLGLFVGQIEQNHTVMQRCDARFAVVPASSRQRNLSALVRRVKAEVLSAARCNRDRSAQDLMTCANQPRAGFETRGIAMMRTTLTSGPTLGTSNQLNRARFLISAML